MKDNKKQNSKHFLDKVKIQRIKGWCLVFLFLVFAFCFPRFLIHTLGEDNPWTSYFYHYGFGLFYTGSGLALALKTGACKFSRYPDKLWFQLIIGGFVFFASFHALWIYLSLRIPFYGNS